MPNVGTGVEGNQGQVKRLKLFRPLNQVGDDLDLVPVPILVLGKLRDIEFNRFIRHIFVLVPFLIPGGTWEAVPRPWSSSDARR